MKPNRYLALVTALWIAGTTLSVAQEPTPLVTRKEPQLIAVLQSATASQKDKADACRELSVVGTKATVPALVALLDDDNLAHMGRYALETIPHSSVDTALREQLGTLKGLRLVGVIGSIGVRKDAKAVTPLTGFLQDSNPDVAQATARALGKIANADAVKALSAALASASEANRLAVCEGLFRCAEAAVAKGDARTASRIYAQLRSLGEPHQVRAGAVRGAILADKRNAPALLRASLADGDYVVFAAAVRAAQEIGGAEVVRVLVDSLKQMVADRQVVVLQTLGLIGDPTAVPAMVDLAREGSVEVRLAALRALPMIGHASAVPILVELAVSGGGDLAKVARESLAAFPGDPTDAAVLNLLNSGDTAARLIGIDLAARRRMVSSLPTLLKAASTADPKVRPAAIEKIGELGEASELQPLLDLLASADASQDLDALEQALGAVCAKIADPAVCARQVSARMAAANAARKSVLLRVLSTVGGPEALASVRNALKDPAREVHATAIRVLGSWRTADAAPELLALAKSSENPTDRILCLRSFLNLASNADVPPGQRLSMCRQAGELIQRTEEKRLLLGVLSNVPAAGAIDTIKPYLDDEAVKDEAAAATVALAERMLRGGRAAAAAPRFVEPLKKVAETTGNPDLARRAKEQLQRAEQQAR